MTKLKTLKDLVEEHISCYGKDNLDWSQKEGEEKKFVFPENLRQEAIRWMNEDMELIKENPLLKIEKVIAERFMERWMFRLNLKKEDLK